MNNISAFGIGAYIIADKSMPLGWLIDTFADDTDAIRFDSLVVSETKRDLNAQMYSSRANNTIGVEISVVPNSTDDQILRLMVNANHASKYQQSNIDVVTLTIKYPDLSVILLRDGRIISGPPGVGAQSSGRYATNSFRFEFADVSAVNTATTASFAISAAASALGINL